MLPSTRNNAIIQSLLELKKLVVDVTTGEVYRVKPNGVTHLAKPKKIKGYHMYQVYWGGKPKLLAAHRIVWIAAHGDIPNNKTIDHINRIKTDNRLANLRLATPKQQSRNSDQRRGQDVNTAKLTKTDVLTMKKEYANGKSSLELSVQFGVSKSTAIRAIKGHTWKHLKG